MGLLTKSNEKKSRAITNTSGGMEKNNARLRAYNSSTGELLRSMVGYFDIVAPTKKAGRVIKLECKRTRIWRDVSHKRVHVNTVELQRVQSIA